MAISKNQPMRPTLIDVVDGYDGLESSIEETNEVVGQLNQELGSEIERAKAAEHANASAIQNETQRASAAEQTLSDDIAAIPIIEYGAQNNIEILADDNNTVSITFADEKESTPYLLISLQCEETENVNSADCYAIITSVTNVGFTARIVNKDALNTIQVTIYWLAIGE